MSKSQSVTQLHNLRQQGGKNVQIGRSQTMLSTSLAKSVTALDEFKYGFPSNGLSTVSNKWWGSSCPEGYEDICGHGANTGEVMKQQSDNVADNGANLVKVDKEQHEGDEGRNVGPQGTGLLMAVRKRIADEGRDALKLGVTRSSGIKKLGRRQKTLLLRIFKSSIPRQWIHGTF
ncbi:uncharacterized protein LOC107416120 [Ziziphus jujuba]|uniref:Uncharacterized protein LOC107416120 n=2 Tax=Ziziphus jujuba TaxID=326968 RepID=A0ABM3IH71_ZIZJJ|nr:uncharacterized protein LOC107416120 [Ziziphus jujuba]XP_048328279.1 uncharacterized protein LOC107416120 [Ziziphus jujuba]XP_048328280.1 uncharacterized protein LOC107416120 [Ziziphus jujuba]XP_048328281.1 uncharacterized protein LOC107416120 [Ziziphus jujuba]XP_060672241.1 uncharacterized protein LOC107416120 [Ziziphus jujuba]KAH7533720.1 hypothetical protein FEM48_Zijuj04G0161600 [Ziziphus jujuba var. spinosa]